VKREDSGCRTPALHWRKKRGFGGDWVDFLVLCAETPLERENQTGSRKCHKKNCMGKEKMHAAADRREKEEPEVWEPGHFLLGKGSGKGREKAWGEGEGRESRKNP